ncbi:MFS general substrate transporter [Sistotremastrum suecicum HHB10207 ss-3]|uniref:MFS general substrate transporter n=1 Tax=Sistotremastrum suecicum HHB10207 ss-3 TaxID=1314776 RepID=A0A166D5P3_9AGAM|nr:MFS general substrate transporter [Sistotremastrum suecicum HHB10207 ss-3]
MNTTPSEEKQSQDQEQERSDRESSEKTDRISTEANPITTNDVQEIDEKKLIRKLDLRLVPWLSILYLLAFLDRTSSPMVSLYGMEKDLHITDTQYLLALTIFFFSYSVFEVPSNIVLKRIRPSIWLSFLMTMWGICMTVQGLVHNYGGLLGTRWLLGFFEAGLFPGVAYYLSCWYKRSELGLRIALFFSAATVSGAFGGLLAAAIENMDGVGGKRGWSWIFILEGIVTIIAGIASFWIIQDFPDRATFITEPERQFLINRLQEAGRNTSNEPFSVKYVLQSMRDYKTWICMLIYMGFDGALFAFSLFTPSIINQLGFKATPANLLSVPVYVWACIITCVVGVLGDRFGRRGDLNMLFFGIGAVGYIILIISRNPALSYFAVYLAACGMYPTIRTAWVSANVEGSYKRSVTLAMCIGFGNLNGAYRAKDTPWYRLGHSIVLIYILTGFTASLIYKIVCVRENGRRERGERDEIIDLSDSPMGGDGLGMDGDGKVRGGRGDEKNGRFGSVEEAKREKGDAWSGYRYVT